MTTLPAPYLTASVPASMAGELPPMDAIEFLFGHSRPDGFIGFGERERGADNIRRVALVPVPGRQRWIPQVYEMVGPNCLFMAKHTFTENAAREYRKNTLGPRIPTDRYLEKLSAKERAYYASHERNVYEINLMSIDLDVGRPGTPNAALGESLVWHRAEAGDIPHPSMFVYSGRGIYAVYRLRESDADRPPILTLENKHLWEQVWRRVHKRIGDELRPYVDESNTASIGGFIKAPGALDDKTGNRVKYRVTVMHGDGIPTYTLDQLADHLQIDTADRAAIRFPRYSPLSTMLTPDHIRASHGARKGTKRDTEAPMRMRYKEIERLAEHRGGFFTGRRTRHSALLVYFNAVFYSRLHSLGAEAAWRFARDRVVWFNREYLHPPKPDNQVRGILKARLRAITRAKAVHRLQVTRDEALDLQLHSLAPLSIRKKRKSVNKVKARYTKGRRDRIAAWIRGERTNAEIRRSVAADGELARLSANALRQRIFQIRKALGIPDPARSRQLHIKEAEHG